ncbi:DUF1653 domain-containing protein [Lusitaniella coriacea LEGE 07157]|uniref:DUF1653 domain-containing protein n=1 Tax=Lusitaniella coriacea LEGE 07157 TaxID=945747 RepID=A0A8J7IW00_9CYAN|nr:DUF1653 domain-containing protein [Lusitaniella coriacea]MBE9117658.1 DUF1653 domain-containing protein [Lusitaniella coriacea LEGE 07157]
MMELKLNSVYRHHKGKYYKTLLVCWNASNSSSPSNKLVIYQTLYEDKEYGNQSIWARPIEEFQELHDGVNPRFEFVCELPTAITL